MKIFNLEKKPRALIFDIDKTLYTNAVYAVHQEAVLIQRLAQEKSWTVEKAQKNVDEWRATFSRQNEGRKPALGVTFVALGVSIATSIRWREENIRPDLFLHKDEVLVSTIAQLRNNYSLAVVTNNPISIARKTLQILGIETFFSVIVGLDSTERAKPNPAPFQLALQNLGIQSSQCASIGDRYEIDIEPALALGTSGILVDGVSDLYMLPEFLNPLI